MSDLFLLLLLVVAVGIGWLLGFQARRDRRLSHLAARLRREYFLGLNHLLSEHSDEAVETFLRALEIDSDAVDTHLALAELFRRKGDVGRAVKVHQGLLDRNDLSAAHVHLVQTGLAKDYLSSGLLDRAETLLRDILSKGSAQQRIDALVLLMEVYQQERDWQNALYVGQQRLYLQPDNPRLRSHLSHYACELAEQAVSGGQRQMAYDYLKQSLSYDTGCGRALLKLTTFSIEDGQWRPALRYLKRFRKSNPDMLSEGLASIVEVYRALQRPKALVKVLVHWHSTNPSATLLIAIARYIKAEEGYEQAHAFMIEQLNQRMTLRGMRYLTELELEQQSGLQPQSTRLVDNALKMVLETKAFYQCGHCGFHGRQMYWQCPRCKEWGAIKPIRGIEGD
ncbi:lipopolysaccharide assembly protein LapB [Pokkaliibacter sp. MBI-7]|uniref:lipopolysaccharide assembly protein LapB n=1 Tax=Pokkaliibacter sp. MBI-7 TaxID=3040600 RepID=UPI00244BF64C|nr:lipopolysaccharide assembly protein LapB [Pokkaliibacter sp. MBI-7]MDH2435761.1 lipopolysaccharide assembly protein LapB [Pokkaliibacter sp. MBI-7]